MRFNQKAGGWALFVALLVAGFCIGSASLRPDAHWTSALLTTLVAFATIFGSTYAILKDIVQTRDDQIVSLEEFGWPFGRVLTLATVLLLVVGFFGVFVGSVFAAGLTTFNAPLPNEGGALNESIKIAMQIGSYALIFTVAGSYFVGRWIGYRCSERGVIALVLAVVVSRSIVILLDLVILGFDQYVELLAYLNASIVVYLPTLGLLVVVGMTGVWRGKRTRGPQYLYYVLNKMPKESRDALLDLAQSEAMRLQEASAERDEGKHGG